MPATLTDTVLSWGAAAQRDLPWRRTRDPWAVLVSELMLQQTQVARVAPKWAAFLERFPCPSACAASPAGEVVRLWAGLGYNRRALNLHRAAQVIVVEHGGLVPHRLADLLALPGVGPYTARAVLAFAFERDVGVVDTNVARVLARAFAGRRLRATEVQSMADHLVPPGLGWHWNQALLDLGATVCTARAPDCDGCPISVRCSWVCQASPAPDPAVGSAGTSGRQTTFAGSDRQGRGRLVEALRHGSLPAGDEAALAVASGWPGDPARADRVLAGLLADGLVERCGGWLRLPGVDGGRERAAASPA